VISASRHARSRAESATVTSGDAAGQSLTEGRDGPASIEATVMPAARGALVAASGSLLDQSINAETAESTENAESHLYKRSLRVLRFLRALRSRGGATTVD